MRIRFPLQHIRRYSVFLFCCAVLFPISSRGATNTCSDLIEQASKQMEQGRYDAAIELLSSGSKDCQRDAGLQTILGVAYVAQKQWDEAEQAFRKAADLAPSSMTSFNLAEYLFTLGNYRDASVFYSGALDDPNLFHMAILKKVICHLDMNEENMAQELLEQTHGISRLCGQAALSFYNGDGHQGMYYAGAAQLRYAEGASPFLQVLRKEGWDVPQSEFHP